VRNGMTEAIVNSISQALQSSNREENIIKQASQYKNDPNKAPNEDFCFAFEYAFRNFLEEALVSHTNSSYKSTVADCMDLSFWCVDNNACDSMLPFVVMEDIFEMFTINQCEEVFEVFENRVSKIRKLTEASSKGRLRLLKASSLLLSKISKAIHARLNGRVLLLVAVCLPYCDKSGLNTRGEIKTDNVTVLEEEDSRMDISVDEDNPVDYNFYRTFWGLQRFFQNPSQVVSSENFSNFIAAANAVIDAFSTTEPLHTGSSIVCGSHSEDYMDVDEDHNSENSSNPVFLKYLTSTKLLNTQLKDPHFRRHILVQFLILFHGLENPLPSTPEFSADQKSTLTGLKTKLNRYLEKRFLDSTADKEFFTTIASLLGRESYWISWKKNNCPDFETVPKADLSVPPATMDVQSDDKLDLGNSELTYLWNLGGNYNYLETDPIAPSLDEFIKDYVEEPDDEPDFSLKNHPLYVWKTCRIITRNRLNLFQIMQYKPDIGPLKPYMKKQLKEQANENQ